MMICRNLTSLAATVLVVTGLATTINADTLWFPDGFWDTAGNSAATPTTNVELADDFTASGAIEHVKIFGSDCPACSPAINGVWLRIYAWTPEGPGDLEYEHFFDAADPGLIYTPNYGPEDMEFHLPAPHVVDGWRFLSVQVDYPTEHKWSPNRANLGAVQGMPMRDRNVAAGEPWGPVTNNFGEAYLNDVHFEIYGAPGVAAPAIADVLPATTSPSGRIRIVGSNFGNNPGDLTIDGHEAHILAWTATEITAYVPEVASPGTRDLVVTTAANVAAAAETIEITPRLPDGRRHWRFAIDADYYSHRPGVGPDGSIYVHDIDGDLYALNADGGLQWIVDTLDGAPGGGDEGPVAIGADGTIHVATNPLGPDVLLRAYHPDGSLRWSHTFTAHLSAAAGPTIGPDGNLYIAVWNNGSGAEDLWSFTPNGDVRWRVNGSPRLYDEGGIGAEIVFSSSSPGGPADRLNISFDQNGPGKIWSFDMSDGSQEWARDVSYPGTYLMQFQQQPAAMGGSAVLVTDGSSGQGGWALRAYDPDDGSNAFTWDPYVASEIGAPTISPTTGDIFMTWDLSYIGSCNETGAERWQRFHEGVFNGGPDVSPDEAAVLATGSVAFAQPGWIKAFDPDDGDVLWSIDTPPVDGANLIPSGPIAFSGEGDVGYVQVDRSGVSDANHYCFIDAVNIALPVIGDSDGDGVVNFDDLNEVLTGWGTAGPGDVNGDGTVNFDDLNLILTNWRADG
ncbi:MAG: PQQ-binding-like beta-propeller repeat protein [Phycisphaerales bacterium]